MSSREREAVVAIQTSPRSPGSIRALRALAMTARPEPACMCLRVFRGRNKPAEGGAAVHQAESKNALVSNEPWGLSCRSEAPDTTAPKDAAQSKSDLAQAAIT